MNDEIKDILDYLDYGVNNLSISKPPFKIEYEDIKKLLDYITNLQESEAYYYGQYKDYKSRCEKAIEYLKSKEDSLFMTFSDDVLNHDELIDKKIGTTLLNILNGSDE